MQLRWRIPKCTEHFGCDQRPPRSPPPPTSWRQWHDLQPRHKQPPGVVSLCRRRKRLRSAWHGQGHTSATGLTCVFFQSKPSLGPDTSVDREGGDCLLRQWRIQLKECHT